MSHTDKDEPYWVTRASSSYIKHDHRDGRCVEETLEDAQSAKRHWPAVWTYPWRQYAGPPKSITCTRERPDENHYTWYGHCPKWYRKIYYFGPERARQRNIMGDAKKWAREDLEDFDYVHRQSRHGCQWDWE